jgi:hypothetical protein
MVASNLACEQGEREEAVRQFAIALGIATTFQWQSEKSWINHSLAKLFLFKGRFDDADP